MKKISFAVVSLGLVALSIAGCPTTFSVCEEGPCGTADGSTADGTSPDSSTDAKTDADPPPPGCDTPNEPLKNPEKCLVDSFGVFVSPTGDDANPGTKGKPFKSLAKALGAGKPRIVACEGEYVGSLDVTTGVSLYGGVSCDFAKAGGRAKVTASKAEYGIKIAKVSAAVLFSDVEVLGIAGVAPSESSIGVFVSESTNVQFVRAKIEAADGADAPPKKTARSRSRPVRRRAETRAAIRAALQRRLGRARVVDRVRGGRAETPRSKATMAPLGRPEVQRAQSQRAEPEEQASMATLGAQEHPSREQASLQRSRRLGLQD